jgi:hypothetical protein
MRNAPLDASWKRHRREVYFCKMNNAFCEETRVSKIQP